MKFKIGDVMKQTHMIGDTNHFVVTDYRSDINRYKVYWIEKNLDMCDWFPLTNEPDVMFGYTFQKMEKGYDVTN